MIEQRTTPEMRRALHDDLFRLADGMAGRDIKDRCFAAVPALLADADALAGALADVAFRKQLIAELIDQRDAAEAEAARLRGALDVSEKALMFYADQHLYEAFGDEQSRADDDEGDKARETMHAIREMCPERRWPKPRGEDWRLAVRRVLRYHQEETALLARILGISADEAMAEDAIAQPEPKGAPNAS